MESTKKLFFYYQTTAENCIKFLKEEEMMKGLMEQNCLLVFLRYVENIGLIQTTNAIKTLLLAIKLIKLRNPKLRNMLCKLEIRMLKDNCKDRPTNDASVVNCLLYQLQTYFNYLVKNQFDDNIPKRTELQLLTTNLFKLSQSSFSKDKELSKYCEFVYEMAEQELFHLWRHINKQIELFQNYQTENFHQFYQKYTNFCTFRRKIPKIRLKKLKEVVINSEINSKIEFKWRKSLNKSNKLNYDRNQNEMSFIPSLNFSKLAIPDDFQ